MSRYLRRMAWRLGRAIYCRARGEPADDDIATDGEAYVQRCVIDAVPSDGRLCALDIGANQGDWTLSLVAGLPAGLRAPERTQLHLVEPAPDTRDRLNGRLAAASVTELVRIHALAMSDTCGRASFHIVGDTSGRNSLLRTEITTSDAIEVEAATLTELFRRLGIARAQLVKMDAEGHDLAILRGAKELLADGRVDVFQFEYNHTWMFSHAFLKDVFDLVEGFPYRVARLRPRTVEILDAWHPELDRFFHANYLLIREPALAWFDVSRGHFDISNTYA
jgi:FkbM family methyltransferase